MLHLHVCLCFHKIQSHMKRSVSYHPFQPQRGVDVLRKMVQLCMKRGDKSLFPFNTSVDTPLDAPIQQITPLYNGRLKVDRICSGRCCGVGPHCTLVNLILHVFNKINYQTCATTSEHIRESSLDASSLVTAFLLAFHDITFSHLNIYISYKSMYSLCIWDIIRQSYGDIFITIDLKLFYMPSSSCSHTHQC